MSLAKPLFAPAAATLVVVLAIVGIVILRSRAPENDTTVDFGKAAAFEAYPASKRKPVPRMAGKTLEGQRLDIESFRGKVVVVNLWGSWCAPCRAEAPDLAAVSKLYSASAVQFVGLDERDNRASARGFERGHGITYPSFDDPAGRLVLAFHGIVPISAVPSTVFLDPQGRLAARVIGRVNHETLRAEIADLLTEAGLPVPKGVAAP